MRLQVVAIGRLKAGPERDLVERYRSRAVAIGRGLGFVGPEVIEPPESRARRTEERQADEAQAIRAATTGAKLIILDETAPPCTSEAFATRLREWRDGAGGPIALVIGGPDGLDRGLRDGGDWQIGFGRLTLPHQLVRILAMEQIYRASTIIAGHPYHRSGSGR